MRMDLIPSPSMSQLNKKKIDNLITRKHANHFVKLKVCYSSKITKYFNYPWFQNFKKHGN